MTAPTDQRSASPEVPARQSPWAPLGVAAFRTIWIATVASNIGTWMHDTAASWLMTSLTTSTLPVALMQTATSAPVIFLALPAGALADVVDRRKLLLITQSWMLVAAGLLGALSLAGAVTPGRLLALTFLLGTGSALNVPAWQATTGDLVPRELLSPAVALTGIATNIARAVGPAIGGLIVALLGPGAVFLLNAVSFLAVIVALARWTPPPKSSTMPAERVAGAIRAGMRYLRHAPALQTALLRTSAFIIGASALWALLPVVARRQLGLGAAGYGVLLGSLGVGAVSGGVMLPRLRRLAPTDGLTLGATVVFAAASVVAGTVHVAWVVAIGMALAGGAWMTAMPIFNVSVQIAAPEWARARAMALYVIAFQGLMAVGGVLWGTVATHAGIRAALLVAAVTLIASGALAAPLRLARWESLDLTPSPHWREPVLSHEIEGEAGPVVITVEYHVRPEDAEAFTRVMRELAKTRRRDGAMAWGLYRDTSDPTRYVELFMAESWAEHLRQHARATMSDLEVQGRAYALHAGSDEPKVTHLVDTGAAPPTRLFGFLPLALGREEA